MFVFDLAPHVGALAFIPLSFGVDLFFPYETISNQHVLKVKHNDLLLNKSF
jgi:hypothetical protein